jgi:hypothetical protein
VDAPEQLEVVGLGFKCPEPPYRCPYAYAKLMGRCDGSQCIIYLVSA